MTMRAGRIAESDMTLRSLLFVPGDSNASSHAPGIAGPTPSFSISKILSRPPRRPKPALMSLGSNRARAKRAWTFIVRVNALDTGLTLDDLAAVVKPGLDAVLIPKVNGAADLSTSAITSTRSRRRPAWRQGREIGERGDRNGKGDVRPWLVRAAPSAVDRLDLGRRAVAVGPSRSAARGGMRAPAVPCGRWHVPPGPAAGQRLQPTRRPGAGRPGRGAGPAKPASRHADPAQGRGYGSGLYGALREAGQPTPPHRRRIEPSQRRRASGWNSQVLIFRI